MLVIFGRIIGNQIIRTTRFLQTVKKTFHAGNQFHAQVDGTVHIKQKTFYLF